MLFDAKRILVVAAHPDDEVLGCGGTMARLAKEGHEVMVVLMGLGRPETANINIVASEAAAKCLGLPIPQFRFHSKLRDNGLDSVPLLDTIRLLDDLTADCILTHHPGDLNVDHQQVARAVLTAFRPTPGQDVKAILSFEIPSSSEWAFGVTPSPFDPNFFVDISSTLEVKKEALLQYKSEMREFPHPRSLEAVSALARWRGAQAGVQAAEAFRVMRAVQ